MRNGSLWSNEVFKKEVIFNELDFETLELDFEVSSIWKHTTLCDKGDFSFIIISQFRYQLSSVLYYQQLSIAWNQVKFYANNYFE